MTHIIHLESECEQTSGLAIFWLIGFGGRIIPQLKYLRSHVGRLAVSAPGWHVSHIA